MPNITIHSKRVETIYAFTVEHKGQKIMGRYITVDGVDEDEPCGLPEEDEKLELDDEEIEFPGKLSDYSNVKDTPHDRYMALLRDVKQAIKDYDKLHT